MFWSLTLIAPVPDSVYPSNIVCPTSAWKEGIKIKLSFLISSLNLLVKYTCLPFLLAFICLPSKTVRISKSNLPKPITISSDFVSFSIGVVE